jgi:predicted ArsR family transcriptional regulator
MCIGGHTIEAPRPSIAEECRREALASLSPPVLRAQHDLILQALRDCGPLTDEQIEARTDLSPNTVRPRRGELVKMNLVTEEGSKRQTASGRKATIWRLAGIA